MSEMPAYKVKKEGQDVLIVKGEYVKSKSGKTTGIPIVKQAFASDEPRSWWLCDGVPVWSDLKVGDLIDAEYEVRQFAGSTHSSTWITKLRRVGEDDESSAPPQQKGSPKSSSEFRTPEQIMRGQALEIAAALHPDNVNKLLGDAVAIYFSILNGFQGATPEDVAEKFGGEVIDTAREQAQADEYDGDVPF